MIGKQGGETVIETVIMQVQLQAGFINEKSEKDTPCTLSKKKRYTMYREVIYNQNHCNYKGK
jgi:hypothetical protein